MRRQIEIKTADSGFINKIYLKYMMASFLANLLGMAVQIINNILLGRMVSSDLLSVVSVCTPIYFIYGTISGFILIGTLTLCARFTGLSMSDDFDKCFTSGLIISTVFTIIVTIILMLLKSVIVSALCPDPALLRDTDSYYTVTVLGGFFIGVCQTTCVNFLRQDGKPNECVVINIVNLIVSVSLCYGLLKSGLAGVSAAAIGQIAGLAIMMIMFVIIIWKRGATIHFVKVDLRTMLSYLKDIVKLGSGSFLENGSITVRALVINMILAAHFGLTEKMTFGIICSMLNIYNILVWSIGAAGVPFIGVFIAERDMAGVRRIIIQVIKKSMYFALPITVACIIFNKYLAMLFGVSDPAEITSAGTAIAIFSLSFFFGIINYTLASLHLNNGHVLLSCILTACRLSLYVIIFSLLLWRPFGAGGIWHSFWIGELMTLITAAVAQCIIAGKKKYISKATLLDESDEIQEHSLSIPVKCSTGGIEDALEKIREFGGKNMLTEKENMYLTLAYEEILTSLRNHALDNNDKAAVDTYILLDEEDIIVRFRTAGKCLIRTHLHSHTNQSGMPKITIMLMQLRYLLYSGHLKTSIILLLSE